MSMRTALVTGASRGIGRACALALASAGHRVVLAARSAGKLAEVAKEITTESFVLEMDMADRDSIANGMARAAKDFGRIDVLVNNAAYGKFGPFSEMSLEEVTGQIELNIVGLTTLTRLFLPGMIARKSGRILNVASTAGFQPGPLMAVYYASKAYVVSFSEAIANELKGSGVTVTCL